MAASLEDGIRQQGHEGIRNGLESYSSNVRSSSEDERI
jgi:hypothetical protein